MVSEANAPDPTEKPPERRKLIAVMYADMVGYSRLIGLDDAGTLDRLRTLRRNLIDPAIDEHGRKSFRLVAIPFSSSSIALMGRCAVPWRCSSRFRPMTEISLLIALSVSASESTLVTRLQTGPICTAKR